MWYIRTVNYSWKVEITGFFEMSILLIFSQKYWTEVSTGCDIVYLQFQTWLCTLFLLIQWKKERTNRLLESKWKYKQGWVFLLPSIKENLKGIVWKGVKLKI